MSDFYDTTDHDCTTDQNTDYGYEPEHAGHPAELPGYEAHPGYDTHPGYEAHPPYEGHQPYETQPGYEVRHDAGHAYHLHVEYDESGYRSAHEAVETPGYADDGGYAEPSGGHLQGLPANYADLFAHESAPATDHAGADEPGTDEPRTDPGTDEPQADGSGAVDGLRPAAGVVTK